MERAKKIKTERGAYKGLEEIMGLPEEIKSEVAECFGDLLLGDKLYDISIAAYYIANKPQKLIDLGDVLLREARRVKNNSKSYSPPCGILDSSNVARGAIAAFSADSLVTKAFVAYALAEENLGESELKVFNELKGKYENSAQGYLAAYEKLKSGDLTGLDDLDMMYDLHDKEPGSKKGTPVVFLFLD